MFYLEKRIPHTKGRLSGYCWAAIYHCPERWPLELLLKHLSKKDYRIIPKGPKEGCGNGQNRNHQTCG